MRSSPAGRDDVEGFDLSAIRYAPRPGAAAASSLGEARRALTAAAVSSTVRSALIAAAAVTPEAADCITPAVTSAALPATHTPGAAVSPVASAGT